MKKNFVKVMFFGALAFTMSTAVTSCKDYDDDVTHLQEQIDKIVATTPVSSDEMKKAIDEAKKSLKEEVTRVEGLLNDKAAQSKLESEIQRVEGLIEQNKGVDESKLTEELAQLKNDLQTLINAKADESVVNGMKTSINDLEAAEATLSALIAAEKKYQESGDITGYYDSAFDKLVNGRIEGALTDGGKIAAYVSNAVSTALTNQLSTINNKIATLTGKTCESLDAFVGKVYNELYASQTGVIDRLNKLEGYTEAIDAFVKKNGANYADYAAVLEQIETSRQQLASIAVPGSMINDAIKAEIKNILEDEDGILAKLQEELNEELAALKGMIQSIVYIPSSADRTLSYNTLFAKKTGQTTWSVAATNATAGELKFRISPASAVASLDDFNKKFVLSLNADELTRAAAPFTFEAKKYENGVLTVAVNPQDEKSYAISVNVTSKVADEDADKNYAKTDINSDYLAVVQNHYYLQSAKVEAPSAPTSHRIVYDDASAAVDFVRFAKVMVNVSGTPTGNATEKEFSTLKVENIFTVVYELANDVSSDDKSLFDVTADGKVTIKKNQQGIVANLDKTATVKAKVSSDAFTIGSQTLAKLGQVKIERDAKEMAHTFATETWTWDNTVKTYTLDESEVYRNLSVNIPVADYQALQVKEQVTDVTKVRMIVGANNTLKVNVPQTVEPGTYETKVVLADPAGAYEITITKTIVVKYPEIPALAFDPVIFNGTVNLALTLKPDANKPSDITTVYDLKEVFSNLNAVETAVSSLGGSVTISIPNIAKFNGLTFSNNELTFNKAQFAWKDVTTKPEPVKVLATVKYGTVEKTIEAPLTIANISGTWTKGATAVTLTEKTATVNLAKDFAWKDYRGYSVWKNGAAVVGSDVATADEDQKHFANSSNALTVYGLTAPTFAFVDAEGNVLASDKYLSLDSDNGKISFTEAGKAYAFVQDYTVRVKVSAESRWGAIDGYKAAENIITVTVPKNVK